MENCYALFVVTDVSSDESKSRHNMTSALALEW